MEGPNVSSIASLIFRRHGSTVVPIEGTLDITAHVIARDVLGSAPGTKREVVLDLTEDSLHFPKVEVTFPPGALDS